MVSQANFFRDDISGDLYPTPAQAIESERESRIRADELFSLDGWEVISGKITRKRG
jgi:hypothetical protein